MLTSICELFAINSDELLQRSLIHDKGEHCIKSLECRIINYVAITFKVTLNWYGLSFTKRQGLTRSYLNLKVYDQGIAKRVRKVTSQFR